MSKNFIRTVEYGLNKNHNPEETAFALFQYLRDRFGWAGTIFARSDVEDRVERPITDDEWEAVKATKYWVDAGAVMCEAGGWDIVDDAIREAGLENPTTEVTGA